MRSLNRATVVAALALTGVGCVSTEEVDQATWRGRPGWLGELNETRTVPVGQWGDRISEDPSVPLALGGSPLDLTRRQSAGVGRSGSVASPTDEVLSSLERQYRSGRGVAVDRALRQFGYDQIAAGRTGSLGPVPDDYLIGVGDELLITVSGSFAASEKVTVGRDGAVRLEDQDPIPVAGAKFVDVTRILRGGYERTRKDFEVSVSMGRLRSIRAQVIGEVQRPGPVEVPALADIIDALAECGGVRRTGSLRVIQLRRADGSTRKVDLYELLVDGGADSIQLAHGDTLLVPPIGATVAVCGNVHRPGIYELLGSSSVEQIFEIAGGLTPFAFGKRIQIERRSQSGRELRDVEDRSVDLRDGDLLMVGGVRSGPTNIVELVGAVQRPGRFELKPGMTVRGLLALGEGVRIQAYLDQAFLSRQTGSGESINVLHAGKSSTIRRRVMVLDLTKAMQGDAAHDIALLPLDRLEIQTREAALTRPTVRVIGPVRSEGVYELTAGLRVSDLIAMAGNLKPEAFLEEAELIRWVYSDSDRKLDVARYRFDLQSALRERGTSRDPLLEQGDRLVVRALRKESVTVSISGDVRFPGTYVFPVGTRIGELLSAAGGVLELGDLRAARFIRKRTAALRSARLAHLAEQTRRVHETGLETMVRDGRPQEGLAAKITLEQTVDVLNRMAQSETSGRIVIPFLRHDFPSSPFNLMLEDGDQLVVPRHRETIAVLGHVFNPGTVVAVPGLTVGDVLRDSGGLTEDGDHQRVYVVQADGRVRSLAQNSNRLRYSTQLLPGDAILVPRRPLERTLGARFSDLLFVVRQMAEIGVLGKHIAGNGDLDVTAVMQPLLRDSMNFEGAVLK